MAIDWTGIAELGTYDTSGFAWSVTLNSDGQTAYVGDRDSGLQIIDVSDGSSPMGLGTYDTSGDAMGVALSADGQTAYVADGYSGLQIIDVSDVNSPLGLGIYDTSGHARGVTLSADGQTAYVADYVSGLQIIDVSDGSDPVLLGTYDTSGGAYSVTLSANGQTAYVADEYSGLQIIDVSDSSSPVLLEAYDTSGHTSDVILSVDGQTAYVADGYSGLQIIDVSDGSSSMLLGTYNTSGAASVTLSTDGQTAYVADSDSGLQIIDVSDGSSPVLLGTYNTSGVATDVTLSVDGQTAYVADGYSGLQIIRISDLILDSLSVVENSITGTVVGDLSATDSEGNATRFKIIGGTGYNLFLINSNNQLVVKSGAMIDYEMLYANPTVSIRTTDSGGLSFDKTLTVSVINVNEPPVNIGLSSTTIEEHSAGGIVVGNLTATDIDEGDIHSFSLVGGSGLSQFEINANNQLVVKSGAIVDYETLPNPTVTIEVKDSGGLSYQKNFTITVEDIDENAVPVIDIGSSDLTGTVTEDASWGQGTGTVKATDSEKDPITYSVVNSLGTYGTLKFDSDRSGQWTYSLDNTDPETDALGVGESGTDTFTVKVKDNQGGEVTQTLTIMVAGHNDAPVVPVTSASSYSIEENRTDVTTIHFDDVDDNQLDYAIAGGADQLLFTIDPVTGALSFKSAPDYETPIDVGADNRYQVTVSGSDGDLTATQDLTIIVTNVDEVPFVFTPAITTARAVSIAQYGSDLSGGSSEVFIKLTLSADMAGLKTQSLIDQVESIGAGEFNLNLDWSQFEAIGNNIAAAGALYLSKTLTSDSQPKLLVNQLEDGVKLTINSMRLDENDPPMLTLVDKMMPAGAWATDLPTRVDLATFYLNPKDSVVRSSLSYDGIVEANLHSSTTDFSFNQPVSSLTIQMPSIVIDQVAGDDRINGLEAQSDITISGSSRSIADGEILTVTLEGLSANDMHFPVQTYQASVTADQWSVTVSASAIGSLSQGLQTIQVSSATVPGHPTASRQISYDSVAPTALVIDAIGVDDRLNYTEHGSELTITGQVEGVEDGQLLTLGFNGVDYQGSVTSGQWSVTIPSSAVESLGPGSHSVTVDVSDVAGNAAAQGIRDFTLEIDTPFGFTSEAISAKQASMEVYGQDRMNDSLETLIKLTLNVDMAGIKNEDLSDIDSVAGAELGLNIDWTKFESIGVLTGDSSEMFQSKKLADGSVFVSTSTQLNNSQLLEGVTVSSLRTDDPKLTLVDKVTPEHVYETDLPSSLDLLTIYLNPVDDLEQTSFSFSGAIEANQGAREIKQYSSSVDVVVNRADATILSTDNKLLNGLTMNLFDQGVDLNQSVGITDGEIEVDETINFDAIKLTEANAYNMDLTISDALDVLRHIVNLEPLTGARYHAADVDNNGTINISDALDVLRHIVRLEMIETFDLIDDQGNRVTQLEDTNPSVPPQWTLIANGDVDQSGSFAPEYTIAQTGTTDVAVDQPIV